MQSEITLNVAQGVGDTFWVAQLFWNHVERINWNILTIRESGAGKVYVRAKEWLHLLPKTGKVDFLPVSAAEYKSMLSRNYRIEDILGHGPGPFFYSANKPLEEGIRLDKIHPGYSVEWNLPIGTAPHPLVNSDYILLYVSSSFSNTSGSAIWPASHWQDLVCELYKRHNWSYPLVIFGASYDERASREIAALLTHRGIRNTVIIDAPPPQATSILKHAKFFIGFQSGMNIVADAFDTRQLMLYVARPDAWMAPAAKGQRLLQYSWPKQKNIDANIYQAATFSMSWIDVANRCQAVVPAAPKASPGSQILLTCSLGDFMALESIVTPEERQAVETIYYATPARKIVQAFIEHAKPFPNLKHHHNLFDKFTETWGTLPSIGYKHELAKLPLNMRVNLDQLQDWGVILRGTEFLSGSRQFYSSCLQYTFADISDLHLPAKYVVLHPYSARHRSNIRDLTLSEWDAVGVWLDRVGMSGVIVNEGSEVMPTHHRILDLSNQLTLPRAIEVVRKSSAFVGCASCFSVVASKHLPAEKLFIKSHEELRNKWARFYYSPHADGLFVFPGLHFLALHGPTV